MSKTVRKLVRECILSVIAEDMAPGISPEQALESLKKFPAGLKKIGVDVSQLSTSNILGSGTQGTAFAVGDRVLKVTKDASEAKAAELIMRKGGDLKCVVKYFNVSKLGDTGLFAILQEKLEPMSPEEKKKFNGALIATCLPLGIARANGSWDQAKKLSAEYVMRDAKKKFKDTQSDEAKSYEHNVNVAWRMLVNDYKIRDLFNALEEMGLSFHDYQADNMMKRRDGMLVLIDLGLSKIHGDAGGGEIKTLSEWLSLT